jgi:hypothetical protein
LWKSFTSCPETFVKLNLAKESKSKSKRSKVNVFSISSGAECQFIKRRKSKLQDNKKGNLKLNAQGKLPFYTNSIVEMLSLCKFTGKDKVTYG